MISDCPECWETPCVCGHQYQSWPEERLRRQIETLQKVLASKTGQPVQEEAKPTKPPKRLERYVITGNVAEGKHKGEKVWLGWTESSGGWWQWGRETEGTRFAQQKGERFEDALHCAKEGSGPWYYTPDPSTVQVEAVPAIVKTKVI